jgi:glyoxylase-like metal-dependent hydrolase (beta-lactamase superfamily II)
MPELVRIWEDASCEVHRMVVGPLDNNVYVLRCRRSGDALLFDAANEHEALLEVCQRLGVRQVVETHGHWDHIQAVPAVREAGIEVLVTEADAGMLPSYDLLLEDDTVLGVGRLRVRTVLTPGHTAGSMCFAVEGTPLLFSGDTLFPGGPGNTKLEGADYHPLHRRPALRSLRARHGRAPRARVLHHHRHGEPAPRRVGRARLVGVPSAA